MKKLGILCFSLNSIGFFIPLIFIYLQPKNYIFCLAYIFFLCCAIVFQLMFTISHVSRLQQLSDPQSRTQIAAGNMMTARLFIAICLILPKYFVEKVSLEFLFIAYGAIFFLIAGFILLKLQEKNS